VERGKRKMGEENMKRKKERGKGKGKRNRENLRGKKIYFQPPEGSF